MGNNGWKKEKKTGNNKIITVELGMMLSLLQSSNRALLQSSSISSSKHARDDPALP